MTRLTPIKKETPLYLEVKHSITKAIENGLFPRGGKLPSENELSEMLNVSRATVRSALKQLESDGVIFTRRGYGSFVNYGTSVGMRMNIAHARGFFNLIMDSGHVPSIASASVEERVAPKEVARSLLLEENERVLQIRRLFLGDGEPAFYVCEYIPKRYLVKDIDVNQLPESIYGIARSYCKHRIAYSNTIIQVAASTEALADMMHIKNRPAVLELKEVHFSDGNVPIVYSDVYVNDELIHFQVRRRENI